jgi:hypothetical protein
MFEEKKQTQITFDDETDEIWCRSTIFEKKRKKNPLSSKKNT